MDIKLLIDAGDMKPGPAVAQQLGPLGINMGKVISDVNTATKEFKGMKVPVILDIDKKTKEFKVKTFSPPTSELLKKELNLEKGSSDQKIFVANAPIETVIKITKIKYPDMLQREFKSAVKSVLGTCAAVGILVENKPANELIKEIDNFDNEIKNKLTESSPEKKSQLDEYFNNIKKQQEANAPEPEETPKTEVKKPEEIKPVKKSK